MIPADNVVMGVPKKGRLYDRCMKLLAGAGMDHRRVSVLHVSHRQQTDQFQKAGRLQHMDDKGMQYIVHHTMC